MSRAIFVRLPEDIQRKICMCIYFENVITCRLLMRRAHNALCEKDFEQAYASWLAISELSVRDVNICRLCLCHHDLWYQTLEDPYDMSFRLHKLMEVFLQEFEPLLRRIHAQERRRRLLFEMDIGIDLLDSIAGTRSLHNSPPHEKNVNPSIV